MILKHRKPSVLATEPDNHAFRFQVDVKSLDLERKLNEEMRERIKKVGQSNFVGGDPGPLFWVKRKCLLDLGGDNRWERTALRMNDCIER